jgi:cell fate regulator YaaT (PSP1 superfamily)
MVEMDMDCSQAENTWFEVKAFLTNAGNLLIDKHYFVELKVIESILDVERQRMGSGCRPVGLHRQRSRDSTLRQPYQSHGSVRIHQRFHLQRQGLPDHQLRLNLVPAKYNKD